MIKGQTHTDFAFREEVREVQNSVLRLKELPVDLETP
ncbi:hypothetical protein C1752_07288 [Acaryochloris thomasi RCC1774]|uniref:Uncharacterized protein n=1 Tax=Acaryochloris thomasi RCC1774 TaxID=1764569 RepID=A0A2W1JB54_9CYAN|nr:hypothetical protein C1752_07288 [Acaryochloris thomasi RCC1774]